MKRSALLLLAIAARPVVVDWVVFVRQQHADAEPALDGTLDRRATQASHFFRAIPGPFHAKVVAAVTGSSTIVPIVGRLAAGTPAMD